MVKTTNKDAQLKFRLPAELKAQIEAAAHGNGRSTTAEIVARLEASFSDEDRRLTPEQVKEMVELMMEPQREQIDARIQVLRAEIDRLTNASKAIRRANEENLSE